MWLFEKKYTGFMRTCVLVFPLLCLMGFARAQQSGFVVHGRISGAANGEPIYLFNIDDQSFLDSAVISGEAFTFTGHVSLPTACWIRYREDYSIIQLEDTIMLFTSPAREMRLFGRAEGGREQSLQNELTRTQHPYELLYFRAYDSLQTRKDAAREQRTRWIHDLNLYQDSAQWAYIQFAKQHPDSYLGLDALYRNRKGIGPSEIEILLQGLDDRWRATAKAQALTAFVYGELAQKGKPFIDFEAQTVDGHPFRFSSLRGQYILLSFWSASCVPCRHENRLLADKYSVLKDRLRIVSFSIDKSEAAWQKASREDHIAWMNVSDLKGANGKIKTQYNVQAIPAWILIDPAGIIIDQAAGIDESVIDRLIRLPKR